MNNFISKNHKILAIIGGIIIVLVIVAFKLQAFINPTEITTKKIEIQVELAKPSYLNEIETFLDSRRDVLLSKGYEDITDYVPFEILDIFRTGIAESFFVSHGDKRQFVHTLGPLKILRKKKSQECVVNGLDLKDTAGSPCDSSI